MINAIQYKDWTEDLIIKRNGILGDKINEIWNI